MVIKKKHTKTPKYKKVNKKLSRKHLNKKRGTAGGSGLHQIGRKKNISL